ncbi:M15 family metallopeptidase [Bacillus sp. 165]|nr:M15 family metallopeptidase [Bacillus sp. 165]
MLSVSLVILSFLFVGIVLVTKTNILPKEQGERLHSKKEDVTFPSYTKTIQGKIGDRAVVNNPDSPLVLVNKKRQLPDFYAPPDLVIPKVRFSYEGDKEKMQMRKEAAAALQKLFQAADQEHIYLFGVSAYRSFDRQSALHTMYKEKEGAVVAVTYSATPGTSEHQTGLAIDVTSQAAKFKLDASFGETKEGIWLAKHAHEYGFVMRYPKDKTKITGYSYEPWHIRYVGNPYAIYLYHNNLTLEEATR